MNFCCFFWLFGSGTMGFDSFIAYTFLADAEKFLIFSVISYENMKLLLAPLSSSSSGT